MLLNNNWETPDGALVDNAVYNDNFSMKYLFATMKPNLKPGANNFEYVSNLMTLPEVSIVRYEGFK